jgi:hypothetical protein
MLSLSGRDYCMKLQGRLRMAFFVMATIVIAPSTMAAQQTATPTTCTALVRTVLSQVGSNCAALERNEACYGYQNVFSTPSDGSPTLSFNQPVQRIPLTDVAVITTGQLNLSDSLWGIAPTNIQANLPVAFPGKGVILVPLGDVSIENGVEPSDALILPDTALAVVMAHNGNLVDVPSATAQTVGSGSEGTAFQVDGISPDSQWLRVYFEYDHEYSTRAIAWINVGDINTVDLTGLPVIASDSKTPMQNFYLSNSAEASPCQDAPPSMVYIQGPQNIEADFTVNGADIRISSAITLRVMPGNPHTMRLVVLSGIATLNPNSANPIILPEGFKTEICLSDERDLGIDHNKNDREVDTGCKWSTPSQITQADLDLARPLQNIPANIMNYQLTLPGLICPSGIGNPPCQIVINNPVLLGIIRNLCQKGILPPSICRLIKGL